MARVLVSREEAEAVDVRFGDGGGGGGGVWGNSRS